MPEERTPTDRPVDDYGVPLIPDIDAIINEAELRPAGPVPDLTDMEAVRDIVAAMEETVLASDRRYTAGEAAAKAGVPHDEARKIWRALGFADFGPARAFTDADVAALRQVVAMVRGGRLPGTVAGQFVRSLGQTMARFAEWQTEAWIEYVGGELQSDRSERVIEAAGDVMMELETLVIYAWRRHLAAATTRSMQTLADHHTVGQKLSVGFADLVGYTRLSRNMTEAELAHLVQTFEDTASDVITDMGGRLVKTLGDEVLFVAFSPEAAVETGLRLIEEIGKVPVLPKLRVGMAYGQVLSRMGDVFGTTVNLASRLTALGPKDTMVIDKALADELRDDDRYVLQAMWQRPVRGLGLVEPWTLRRKGDAVPE